METSGNLSNQSPTVCLAPMYYHNGESRVIDHVSKDCFEQGIVELFDITDDPDEEKNVATANPEGRQATAA